MSIEPGTTLGSYEVIAKIGQGGMGEVYRARDTKLDRDVALKVLPPAFTDDPDRLARFEREAKVLASLNHPNIGHIYGLEEAEGQKALVLELIDGPTLADRIEQGPIPVDEALPIAKQIAEALESAHEQGVIHRDLKPANIKVRDDGTVKVLDFGLAKAFQPDASDPHMSMSPTISLTAAATQMGMVIGTAAYMAPEQAKGKAIDKRADIWSFGCVLFEMLTGAKVFAGGDVSDTLAYVLTKEVDWSTLPDDVPQPFRHLLTRCLERDPKRRLRDIGDAWLELEGSETSRRPAATESRSPAVPRLPIWQRPAGVAATVLVALALGGLAVWTLTPVPPTPSPTRVALSVPPSRPVTPTGQFSDVTISEDGRSVVYQTTLPGVDLRLLNQFESVPLRGAEQAVSPFMSPDGGSVGFVNPTGNLMQRVSTLGGPPVTITELTTLARGASWGPDDVIVFGLNLPGGLWSVPAAGGEPTPLTVPVDEGDFHWYPEVLPNGSGVLFTRFNPAGATQGQIAVFDVSAGDYRVIVETGTFPRYASSGHIVYGVEGTLRAVAFDQETLTVSGDPVPVVENVLTKGNSSVSFDLSGVGDLVYVVGGSNTGGGRTFVWVDDAGNEQSLSLPPRTYIDPRVSPDGRRIAVSVVDDGQDLWVYDAVSAAGLRLTQDFLVRTLVWTPDGSRVVFASGHEGPSNIYSVATDGSGEPELLLESPEADFPTSVTPDGRAVVFSRLPDGPGTPHREIWELALDGSEPAVPLLQGVFARGNAEYSPDGNWLVYRSDQSGQMQVYVQPYPGPGPVVPVSIGGGDDVMWAPDGSRLLYRLDTQMMAVTFNPGDSMEIGPPTPIFEGRYYAQPNGVRQHHIAPDGRFLMMTDGSAFNSDGGLPSQVVLVRNWFQELIESAPIR